MKLKFHSYRYPYFIFFFLFILIFVGQAVVTSYERPKSPYYYDGQFHNQHERSTVPKFWDYFRGFMFATFGPWPDYLYDNETPRLKEPKESAAVVTFINHASFLIEIGEDRILFDPMFSQVAGLYNTFGVKRRRDPGLSLDQLPLITAVAISHNHYDHLDLPTLRALQDKNPELLIIVPIGDQKWMKKEGFINVKELQWWQDLSITSCLNLTFVPAQHQTARGLFDRNQSHWGGYVGIYEDFVFYHAGDTGYQDHFEQIRGFTDRKNLVINLAMLPIGSYKPKNLLSYVHMDPHGAVAAHNDLGSLYSIGMHYETFRLTPLGYNEAATEFQVAHRSIWNPQTKFELIKPGTTVRIPLKQLCAVEKPKLINP